MTVQFSGQRPGEELNGLEALHDDFMDPATEPVVVVGVVKRAKRVLNDETGDEYPVVRFSRVEPVLNADDREQVEAIMNRAYLARTGNEALDLPEVDE